jgi:glycosyltransferase involved in cell wall biosynthesis
MWKGARVIVVVPAWEEAPRIGKVLISIPDWVDAIVVVDDGSSDSTSDAARAVGDARVEVVRHDRNRGVGAAIATGYRRALDGASASDSARDAVAVMAGDGQMAPRDLAALVDPVVEGLADYVKGDRFGSKEHRESMPVARLVGGRLFSWATSVAIGLPISDSQCGYTAISRAACAKLDLDGLWPRYGYPNDLLSQLVVRGLRVSEVPVRAVYADEVSRLKARHLPFIAGIILRAWVRRIRLRSSGRFPR